MGEVADPDRAPADLVLIGRADAAAGGADLALARPHPREARRARGGAAGSAGSCRRCADCRGVTATPCAAQLLDLARCSAQGSSTTPLPMTDELARPDDARRQQRQLVGLLADDERVAGIVAALEAHDDVGALASQSTILPLPSSPHWAPITVTFAMRVPRLRTSSASRLAVTCEAQRPRRASTGNVPAAPVTVDRDQRDRLAARLARPRWKVAMLTPASPSSVPSRPMKPGLSSLMM